jgi:hypothetical protein
VADERVWAALFPLFFIGMWLLVTTLLGAWSGWTSLQDEYPDRTEEPRLRLRFQSGALGSGNLWSPWGNVQYGNCLRLDVCASGLRISMWRIFGPFLRPFFVPWHDITASERRMLLFKMYRLSLGRTGRALTIPARTYRRLAAVSPLSLD